MKVFNKVIHKVNDMQKYLRGPALTSHGWKAGGLFLVFCIAAWFAFNQTTPAPEVRFTLISGKTISPEDLKGKIYWVHFWSTHCASCMAEMPGLVSIYEKFKSREQDFECIAVAVQDDFPEYVRHYSQTRQLPFNVALDKGDIARKFGHVQLTPTTFFINAQGQIVKKIVGPINFRELDKWLESVLFKHAPA